MVEGKHQVKHQVKHQGGCGLAIPSHLSTPIPKISFKKISRLSSRLFGLPPCAPRGRVYTWGMDLPTIVGFTAAGLIWAIIIGIILAPLVAVFFLVWHLVEVELLGRKP